VVTIAVIPGATVRRLGASTTTTWALIAAALAGAVTRLLIAATRGLVTATTGGLIAAALAGVTGRLVALALVLVAASTATAATAGA
jgi:hypothetical protein